MRDVVGDAGGVDSTDVVDELLSRIGAAGCLLGVLLLREVQDFFSGGVVLPLGPDLRRRLKVHSKLRLLH